MSEDMILLIFGTLCLSSVIIFLFGWLFDWHLAIGKFFLRSWVLFKKWTEWWRMLPEEREVIKLERQKALELKRLELIRQQDFSVSQKEAEINKRKDAAVERQNWLQLEIQGIRDRQRRAFEEQWEAELKSKNGPPEKGSAHLFRNSSKALSDR